MSDSSSAVAVAAVILPKGAGGRHHTDAAAAHSHSYALHSSSLHISDNEQPNNEYGFAVLPVERAGPGMFLTEPSLPSLISWAATCCQLNPETSNPTESKKNEKRKCSAVGVPVVLFFPLSVTSTATLPSSTSCSSESHPFKKTYKQIKRSCKKHGVKAIVFNVSNAMIMLSVSLFNLSIVARRIFFNYTPIYIWLCTVMYCTVLFFSALSVLYYALCDDCICHRPYWMMTCASFVKPKKL